MNFAASRGGAAAHEQGPGEPARAFFCGSTGALEARCRRAGRVAGLVKAERCS
jgi:hypothetical protein